MVAGGTLAPVPIKGPGRIWVLSSWFINILQHKAIGPVNCLKCRDTVLLDAWGITTSRPKLSGLRIFYLFIYSFNLLCPCAWESKRFRPRKACMIWCSVRCRPEIITCITPQRPSARFMTCLGFDMDEDPWAKVIISLLRRLCNAV